MDLRKILQDKYNKVLLKYDLQISPFFQKLLNTILDLSHGKLGEIVYSLKEDCWGFPAVQRPHILWPSLDIAWRDEHKEQQQPILFVQMRVIYCLNYAFIGLTLREHCTHQPSQTQQNEGRRRLGSFLHAYFGEHAKAGESEKKPSSSSIPHKSKIHINCVIEYDSKSSCKINYITHPCKTALKLSYVIQNWFVW